MSKSRVRPSNGRVWSVAVAGVGVAISFCAWAGAVSAEAEERAARHAALRASERREVARCVSILRVRGENAEDASADEALRAFLADPSHAEFCREERERADAAWDLISVRAGERARWAKFAFDGPWLPTPMPYSLSGRAFERIASEYAELQEEAAAWLREHDPEFPSRSWCGTCAHDIDQRKLGAQMLRIYRAQTTR